MRRGFIIVFLLMFAILLVGCNPAKSHVSDRTRMISVVIHGGLCPVGECKTETIIKRDGSYSAAQFNGKTVHGKINEDLARQLFHAADHDKLTNGKFKGECPTAADGSELIITFQRLHKKTIASCQDNFRMNAQFFRLLNKAMDETMPAAY